MWKIPAAGSPSSERVRKKERGESVPQTPTGRVAGPHASAGRREPWPSHLARDASWELLVIAIQKLIEELRLHDLEENRLIQEAFVNDLGGG